MLRNLYVLNFESIPLQYGISEAINTISQNYELNGLSEREKQLKFLCILRELKNHTSMILDDGNLVEDLGFAKIDNLPVVIIVPQKIKYVARKMLQESIESILDLVEFFEIDENMCITTVIDQINLSYKSRKIKFISNLHGINDIPQYIETIECDQGKVSEKLRESLVPSRILYKNNWNLIGEKLEFSAKTSTLESAQKILSYASKYCKELSPLLFEIIRYNLAPASFAITIDKIKYETIVAKLYKDNILAIKQYMHGKVRNYSQLNSSEILTVNTCRFKNKFQAQKFANELLDDFQLPREYLEQVFEIKLNNNDYELNCKSIEQPTTRNLLTM